MTHSASDVSVVLPVLNGERFLADALESVASQSAAPGEILVVDGGSTDRSREISRGFDGVRILTQPGRGLSNAWNHGIRCASGNLIAFIESDDRWPADKLAEQVGFLEHHPECDYVIGRVRFFIEPGHGVPRGFKSELLQGDQPGRIPGTLMVRRHVFESVGFFDESLAIAADVDWFARCKDAGVREGRIEATLLQKRVHGSNLSNNAADNTKELLSLLRSSIRRQQQGDTK
jgi:glycosyltransferase involved in cell wall biosynthesis